MMNAESKISVSILSSLLFKRGQIHLKVDLNQGLRADSNPRETSDEQLCPSLKCYEHLPKVTDQLNLRQL